MFSQVMSMNSCVARLIFLILLIMLAVVATLLGQMATAATGSSIVQSVVNAPIVPDGNVAGAKTDVVITLDGSLDPSVPGRMAEPGPSNQASGSSVTCSNPTAADAKICRQIEELILKSTVRIRIQTWVVQPGESGYEFDSSTGHATLKDGRYLVTHNHISVPLSIRPRAGEPEAYGGEVILFNSEGQRRFRGPLSDFELVWEDPETLVITHKENGFFEKLGFVSAAFKEWSSLPLTVGMEVAQVDWDGTATRVDWTTVEEINIEERVPWLVLNDDITVGASGGGVFWQGTHIANNWLRLRTQYIEDSGALVDATTKAALNSANVVGKFGQRPSLNGSRVGELGKKLYENE